MTDGSTSAARVAKSLAEKQSISICLPSQATLDAVAAGLALYFSLKNEGKSVSIASPNPIDPNFRLPGQDAILSELSSDGDVLVVSIPYTDGGVDNISYNIDGDRLNIHISPESGQPRLDKETVTYTYTGGKPDAIVTLYAPTLKSIGSLHENHQDQFEGVEIINIDRHFTNSKYGTLNFIDKQSPSMTQMVNDILRAMKVNIDKDIATILFDGLSAATNNFTSHSVNAQTFRMAAFLLEQGATKKQGLATAPAPVTQPMSQPLQQVATPQPEQTHTEQPEAPAEQQATVGVTIDQTLGELADKQNIGTAESKEGGLPAVGQTAKPQLKPQIFQGGMNKG